MKSEPSDAEIAVLLARYEADELFRNAVDDVIQQRGLALPKSTPDDVVRDVLSLARWLQRHRRSPSGPPPSR